MERNTLEKFFTSKHFVIPSYQRDYAWTQQNIDDLLNDIAETIETRTSHYIGTFILSRQQGDGSKSSMTPTSSRRAGLTSAGRWSQR